MAQGDPLGGLKVGVISLGCAKNLVDTELALGHLLQAGAEITTDEHQADVLIVNTCGFIEAAREESMGEIHSAVELRRSGRCRCLLVAGCLVQRHGEDLARALPEVDRFIGVGDPEAMVTAIGESLGSKGVRLAPITEPKYLHSELTPRLRATPPWTAWVKIADGCDHECGFCIIPRLRGRYRSRPLQSIVAEAQQLHQDGVREINLIAQDTTRYGQDLDGGKRTSLAELLQALATETGMEWIRLLYCFPDRLTDGVIDAISRHDCMAPYVDLPLQHVSADVLRAMKRPGSAERYAALIEKLRQRIPGVAIRSAFIVGLPGETDAHFLELRDFVDAMRFDRLFVFEYSREEGTAAALMENQVPREVATERFHELMGRQTRISLETNRGLVGTEADVLCEGVDAPRSGPQVAHGRSARAAPDVDLSVHVLGTKAEPGQFVRVRLTDAHEYELVGRAISEPW